MAEPIRQRQPAPPPWTDMAARRVPPTCERCTAFQPDLVNPVAGMGACVAGHGYHHPMQRHWCSGFQEK